MSNRKHSFMVMAAVVVAVALAMIPNTDEVGGEYVDSAFKRALVSYALARGLNGVISVAQGTEVAIQPAGVGINFAPGEILDPVNDLVERFSWIMMLASSSLGVQKVLLSMSAWQGLLLGLIAMAVVVILAQLLLKDGDTQRRIKAGLGRAFLLLLILRFMMPAIAIANHWVYDTFLKTDYVEATAELQIAKTEISKISDEVAQDHKASSSGFVDKAKSLYQQMRSGVDLDSRFEQYTRAAQRISENSIRLIVVFLMQTVVFPLLFLMLVVWWSRALFSK